MRRNPAFFVPVPDWEDRCRNADAGVSFLDADAHLCKDAVLTYDFLWRELNSVYLAKYFYPVTHVD
jgi:hypothetical protein